MYIFLQKDTESQLQVYAHRLPICGIFPACYMTTTKHYPRYTTLYTGWIRTHEPYAPKGRGFYGTTAPVIYYLNICETRDRCYDFFNIFAEKFRKKIGVFDSKQS
jgi:hypothetical protein